MADKDEYLEELANIFKDVIQAKLVATEKLVTEEEPPQIEKKDIIEYQRNLRVPGMGKFNAPCYVSAINYFRSEKDKEAKNACGAAILYMEDADIDKKLKILEFTDFDGDEQDQVKGKCCELLQQFSDQFLSKIGAKGYPNLVSGDTFGGRNTIQDGVPFSYDQYELYEVKFFIKDSPFLVLDLSMTKIK